MIFFSDNKSQDIQERDHNGELFPCRIYLCDALNVYAHDDKGSHEGIALGAGGDVKVILPQILGECTLCRALCIRGDSINVPCGHIFYTSQISSSNYAKIVGKHASSPF